MASLLHSSVIVVLFVLSIVIVVHSQFSGTEEPRNQDNMCNKLAEDPYFETDMVVGQSWRVYYSWNMNFDSICLDLVFKNATPQTVQRFWSNMNEYMEQQPAWDSAALLLVSQHNSGDPIGMEPHELLLLADQGVPGRFQGVPTITRGTPMKRSVRLLKFQFKLFRNGKYLVMMDCIAPGVYTMSARSTEPLNRTEVLATASPLGLGNGFPACTMENNK